MLVFRYRNTNCFFIKSSNTDALLAVDAGWPCTLFEYAKNLKTIGYGLDRISWAMVTHFHMDHAGLIGEFMDMGVSCILFENQGDSIDVMERMILKDRNYRNYRRIEKTGFTGVDTGSSARFFDTIGIRGRAVVTPGHSDDSVSFVTEDGEALIGDLSPIDQVMPDDSKTLGCYETLRRHNVRRVYPSHAPTFMI